MPIVNISLKDVKGFEELPLGTYYTEVVESKYVFQSGDAKGDSLRVRCRVLDEGDSLGKDATIFVSLSPKAIGRAKRTFFAKWGEAVENREEGFDVDDDDNLVDPDFVGARVIIESYDDKPKQGETTPQRRIQLVSVEEWDEAEEEAPAPRVSKAKAEEPADEDEEEEEAPRAARRPVATAAKDKRRSLR